MSTKIHVLVDALGNPLVLGLTPGQVHDLVAAPELIAEAAPEALIADVAALPVGPWSTSAGCAGRFGGAPRGARSAPKE